MSSKRASVFQLVTARRIHIAAVTFFAALVLLLGRPAAQAVQTPTGVAPLVSPPTNQIIVQFAPAGEAALAAAGADQLLDRLSTAAGLTLTMQRPMSGDAYVLRLPARIDEAAVTAMAARIAALPEVVYAEPDAIMQIIASPPLADAPAANVTPDDTRFDDQWHYRYDPGVEEGLNLLPAWGIPTGSATSVVAVIDTGIAPSSDLRIAGGFNCTGDADAWRDREGHGTHVSGIIGADGRFEVTVRAGENRIAFGLWENGDVDEEDTLTVKAQLVDAEGNATHHEHGELTLNLTATDEAQEPPALSTTTRE